MAGLIPLGPDAIKNLTEDDLYKQFKEEMVSGFKGLPEGTEHRMLLLAVFYNEVFYLQQVLIHRLMVWSPRFRRFREKPYEGPLCFQWWWLGWICLLDILVTCWP